MFMIHNDNKRWQRVLRGNSDISRNIYTSRAHDAVTIGIFFLILTRWLRGNFCSTAVNWRVFLCALNGPNK